MFVGLDGWVFHKLFRKAEQKDLLNNAITCIAKGDTGFRLDTKKLTGKERTVGDHINNIGSGLDTALQEKVKSERLKADLITNVSHDIKTPLTSIINYVDLIWQNAAAFLTVCVVSMVLTYGATVWAVHLTRRLMERGGKRK